MSETPAPYDDPADAEDEALDLARWVVCIEQWETPFIECSTCRDVRDGIRDGCSCSGCQFYKKCLEIVESMK